MRFMELSSDAENIVKGDFIEFIFFNEFTGEIMTGVFIAILNKYRLKLNDFRIQVVK